MSSDLKQELLDLVERFRVRPGKCPCLLDSDADKLRARLQRATVTEPEVAPNACPCCGQSRPQPPDPAKTNEELRSLLQAALPGWTFLDRDSGTLYARPPGSVSYAGIPRYAQLRKEGGIEACARALRVLAGVEGE